MFRLKTSIALAVALTVGAGAAHFEARAQSTMTPPDPRSDASPSDRTTGGPSINPSSVPGTLPGAPATAPLTPEAWVGLPVVTSEGKSVGQVSQVRPGAGGQSNDIVVKSNDGKTLTVPATMGMINGRTVQLKATSDEVKKMVN
jgi:sporulation protein YlmC with PRC-barrel domain